MSKSTNNMASDASTGGGTGSDNKSAAQAPLAPPQTLAATVAQQQQQQHQQHQQHQHPHQHQNQSRHQSQQHHHHHPQQQQQQHQSQHQPPQQQSTQPARSSGPPPATAAGAAPPQPSSQYAHHVTIRAPHAGEPYTTHAPPLAPVPYIQGYNYPRFHPSPDAPYQVQTYVTPQHFGNTHFPAQPNQVPIYGPHYPNSYTGIAAYPTAGPLPNASQIASQTPANVAGAAKSRQKKLATLKRPDTKEEIPLGDESSTGTATASVASSTGAAKAVNISSKSSEESSSTSAAARALLKAATAVVDKGTKEETPVVDEPRVRMAPAAVSSSTVPAKAVTLSSKGSEESPSTSSAAKATLKADTSVADKGSKKKDGESESVNCNSIVTTSVATAAAVDTPASATVVASPAATVVTPVSPSEKTNAPESTSAEGKSTEAKSGESKSSEIKSNEGDSSSNSNNSNAESGSGDTSTGNSNSNVNSVTTVPDGKSTITQPNTEPDILKSDPNRYSPTNPNGKKRYCKEFLVAVCTSICKLPDPYVSVYQGHAGDRILRGGTSGGVSMPREDNFAPRYLAHNSQFNNRSTGSGGGEPTRRTSQHMYAGRNSASMDKPRKVINSASLTQEVELKTASNPWKPSRAEKKEDVSEEEAETLKMLKSFRGILNKLTPENFDTLSEKVRELPMDTMDRLERAISVIFSKALDEPGFCELYGRMCLLLRSIGNQTMFQEGLLRKCQERFDGDIYQDLKCSERNKAIEEETDPAARKLLEEELFEDMYKARMRGLGLMKFIGELFKINMLNHPIMLSCVSRLLADAKEESLECLCDLLKTIGEKLDKDVQENRQAPKQEQQQRNAAPNKSSAGGGGNQGSAPGSTAHKGAQSQPQRGVSYAAAALTSSTNVNTANQQQQIPAPIVNLDQAFQQLKALQKDPKSQLSSRIRFRLMDTIELRERLKWAPRRALETQPKKLDEIRKETEEKTRRQMATARKSMEGNRPSSGKPMGQSGSMMGPGGRAPTVGDREKFDHNPERNRHILGNFGKHQASAGNSNQTPFQPAWLASKKKAGAGAGTATGTTATTTTNTTTTSTTSAPS